MATMIVDKKTFLQKNMNKEFSIVYILMAINLFLIPSLATAMPSDQANNTTNKSDKLCQYLLQKAYPKRSDQLAYASGYDGILPKNWDAYNRAQRMNCIWVSQRKLGEPCVYYWLNECRGKKPANIPVIFSPRQ